MRRWGGDIVDIEEKFIKMQLAYAHPHKSIKNVLFAINVE
jgi:hypothetical protein